MAFDEKEWMTKMDRAQMAEEIRAVVTKLPDRGPPMTYDDPDYFFMGASNDIGTFDFYHKNYKDLGLKNLIKSEHQFRSK